MKRPKISWKYILYSVLCLIAIIFTVRLIKTGTPPAKYDEDIMDIVEEEHTVTEERPAHHPLESADERDDVAAYLNDVSNVMREADFTVRHIGLKFMSMKEGVERMDDYIDRVKRMQHSEQLLRHHKMILLAFHKIRKGLLLFSAEHKETSVKLVKNGSSLLKYAAKEIVGIAKEEGLVKEKKQEEKKGE